MAGPLLQTLLKRPPPNTDAPELPTGTGTETGFDKGMSLLSGISPVSWGPDNQWQRGGALLAAGAGIPLFAKIKSGAAIDALLDLLTGYKTVPPQEAAMKALVASRVTPSRGVAAQEISAPRGFGGLPAPLPTQASQQAQMWNQATAKATIPVQTVRGQEELADIVPSGGRQSPVAPTLSTKERGGIKQTTGLSKLTDDDVRAIRKMGTFQQAMQAYPNINPSTLRSILTRDTWSWLKD